MALLLAARRVARGQHQRIACPWQLWREPVVDGRPAQASCYHLGLGRHVPPALRQPHTRPAYTQGPQLHHHPEPEQVGVALRVA